MSPSIAQFVIMIAIVIVRELNKGLPQNTAVFRFYVIRHAHKDTGDVPSNTQYNQIGDNRSFGCLITVIRDINRKSEF